MVKENLNKENFWDDLYKKYPKGVDVFCDWIDEYKKKNNWLSLFTHRYKVHITDTQEKYPKFHDLPLAMQIGIWIEFVIDRGGCEWEIDDMFSYDWREDITGYCKMLHEDSPNEESTEQ